MCIYIYTYICIYVYACIERGTLCVYMYIYIIYGSVALGARQLHNGNPCIRLPSMRLRADGPACPLKCIEFT